ncbi:hypothetical protein [Chengkuizengella axinellae]|uniref:DUF4489 domain-containing protein n=1 Tax=Chengkuizengella axinellae TaxID=3064388 RepID=A0ABT9J0M9_9BACL|nr:hypothetical protein [Chengkuizengella sp. 2205SS18-9]MDP5275169.1 hypothetical protein [Chengkuizengella sp. 2205SS18-9]
MPLSAVSFPISQVKAVSVNAIFPDIKLLPIKKSNCTCKCIEDPATRLLEENIEESVSLSALVPLFLFENSVEFIEDVGEGIVVFSITFGTQEFQVALSTCAVTRVETLIEQKLPNS